MRDKRLRIIKARPGVKDTAQRLLNALPEDLRNFAEIRSSYTESYLNIRFDFLCTNDYWIDCRSFSFTVLDGKIGASSGQIPNFCKIRREATDELIKLWVDKAIEGSRWNQPSMGCGCCICNNWGYHNWRASSNHCKNEFCKVKSLSRQRVDKDN